MSINKKYGFIFLILGLVLFAIAGVYLLKGSPTTDGDNNDDDIKPIKMVYIKSKDIVKRTKVFFPIYEKMVDTNYINSEYNVTYSNNDEDLYVEASTIKSNITLEEYDNTNLEKYFSSQQADDVISESSKEVCDYYCKRYKRYKDNKIISDVYVIYVKLSAGDIAEVMLHSYNRELPEELINSFKKEIKVTNDATYKIGKIDNSELVFDFIVNANKNLIVKIANDKYEEVEDSVNTLNITTLKNKNNNSLITMTLRKKEMDVSAKEELDLYLKSLKAKKTDEIIHDDKTFYKYTADGKIYYAYIIDNDSALFLESNEIEITDFTNIEVTNK